MIELIHQDFTIQLLPHDDLEGIEFCSNYLVSAWGISSTEAQERITKYAQQLDKSFCIIAKYQNQPIGMMALFPRTRLTLDGIYEPWAAGLYVSEAFRNIGIGAKILDFLCIQAKLLGYTKVHLATDKDHLKEWYRSLNWHPVGRAFDKDHEYQVFMKLIE
jgi:GNAT superfamily N-acetyltransferase